MDLNKKHIGIFLAFLALGFVIGTLAWEILERLLALAGLMLELRIKDPVGFDFHAIALYVRLNLGSLLGLVSGGILFKLL